VIGGNDTNLPAAKKTAKYMANFELQILEGESHLTAYRTPAFAAAIKSFIGQPHLIQGSPESVGLSTKRLQRIDKFIESEIDAGRKSGAAVLVARHGKIAYCKSFGFADLEHQTPLRTDAYFRIYSTTKPIVSVALLMLYEEGKFQLTDPLEKFIPAMKDVKVYAGEDADGQMILETPKRKPTIQDVFRHTAGFELWSLPQRTPSNSVQRAYAEAGVKLESFESIRDVVENKLPTLPLLYHPGERWVYSVSHSVQAYLVEYFSGLPIDQFLKERLFKPLGMHDSFYGDPPDHDPRRTVVYGTDGNHRLRAVELPLGVSHSRFRDHPIGGGGLTMTLSDYAKFSQMLLNRGSLDGNRILGRKTVELMTTNHLSPEAQRSFGEDTGYGLGVAVRLSLPLGGNLGSIGQFGWGGAATTSVTIDPREDMIVLAFTQYVPQDSDFLNRLETLAYQSIVDE
jgi:CubicO group peptidase (beta-lactamase class C family)